MELLDYTQNAVALIAGINDNLEEMGVDARVSTSISASQLVNVLNGVFNDVDGTVELSTDDNAETFVGNLNLNFEAAAIGGGGGDTPVEPSEYSLPAYKSALYGTESTGEMKATLDDVKALTLINGEFDENNLIFVLSTDLHTDASYLKEGTTIVYRKPFEESASNMKEFIRLATLDGINISNVVCLGDFTDGMRKVKSTLISYVSSNVINPLIKLGEVKPLLLTIGNHDNNVDSNGGYPCLTRNEIYNLYFKDSNGEHIVDFDAVNSITVNGETFFHEYYKDFDTQKIRVVVLDCNPVSDTVQEGFVPDVTAPGARNNNTQKDWWFPSSSAQYLGRMFGVSYTGAELTDKSDMMPEDYKLIVLCHAHFQSINLASNPTINMSKYVYNLLSANRDKVIAMMSGHRHKDIVSVSPVPAILTGCNKIEGTETLEETSTGAVQKYSRASRSKDNHTADLWDVVIINKNNNVINTIRFGAGYNRRLHTDYINIQVGDTYTLEPTIQSANGFTWNIQNCCYSSKSYMDSTPYISVENGVVSILQANASYNRYLVWAASSEGTWREYWCIEVLPSNNS